MKISELPGDEDSGPTCRTYVFQNESHTLGNALKCIINRYDDVEFCGYTVPHPAEAKMHFRIQSRETPALEILKRGLKDLEKKNVLNLKLLCSSEQYESSHTNIIIDKYLNRLNE